MRARYSLNKAPATFDFCNFLARAELERRRKGDETLEINICPGERDWSIRDKTISSARKRFAARDLLPQLAWLLPSVVNVSFDQDDAQDFEYVNLGFNPGPLFRASEWAREQVREFLSDKPHPVSISVRQSSFQPERNANIEEWALVAAWLEGAGYTPVWVHDIERHAGGYAPASLSVDFRLALYEQCHTNLMTNSGPMVLALMSDCPVAAFKMVVPSLGTCTMAHLANSYFHPRADWGLGKHIFWKDDRAEKIIPELEKLHFFGGTRERSVA